MKHLQTAGGIAALVGAATYLFAIALVLTTLAPMADPTLDARTFMSFLTANKTLIFVWHSVAYLLNGCCLVVLILALHERFAEAAPRRAKTAAGFGLIWSAFVFLSGFITNYGMEALVGRYGSDPAGAASLRLVLETVTLGIDSSDRFLGGLWVGMVSWAALDTRLLPRPLGVLGIIIGSISVAGSVVPAFTSLSYVFGLGVIVWWMWLGIVMLHRGLPVRAAAI